MSLKIIIALCLSILSSKESKNDCDVFKNGKYHVTFKSFFKEFKDYEIVINNGIYTQYETTTDSIKGSIESIYKCQLFIFKPSLKIKLDSAGIEVDKLLRKSFGEDCIEIEQIEGDTIHFRTTYSGNLHITINQGKFIKIH